MCRWCVRVAVMAVVWLLGVMPAEAQIRIVPRERLDSVANPTTVGRGRMLFSEGRTANVDIPVVEFGTLSEEAEPWSRTIEWTNRGSEPLVVTRVTTGCSCVRAEHSTQPVRVGAKGSIKVTFNPKGRVGGVAQRVWIYTNLSTKTPTAVLELRGRVLSSKANSDYPLAMGDLRLGAGRVTLSAEGRASVACKNAGGRALRLTADAMLSSPEVTLRTEPAVLNPGVEGVLVVEYKGPAIENRGAKTERTEGAEGVDRAEEVKGVEWTKGAARAELVRLYVGGLELPPRMRKLEVEFAK